MRTTLPWLIENLQSQSPNGSREKVSEEGYAEPERDREREILTYLYP